jgi:predicted small metal-binding protein
MAWSIRCDCGWEADAESDELLVAAMLRHLADAHPDLANAPSAADLLAMAEES